LLAAAIAGTAAAQSNEPFSHRVHLALKLECTNCHAAALNSAHLEDDLLPKVDVCLKCHKTATIQTPPTTRLARFDHQLHLKLGKIAPIIAAAIDHKTYFSPPSATLRADLNTTNACQACHRGLEVSDKPDHGAFPQMADCLVCHSQIAPPDSCEFCHAKGADLKTVAHTPDFLDTHTTGKLGLDLKSCAICHGRKFHCLGCH
jgi:hypothetical protein